MHGACKYFDSKVGNDLLLTGADRGKHPAMPNHAKSVRTQD